MNKSCRPWFSWMRAFLLLAAMSSLAAETPVVRSVRLSIDGGTSGEPVAAVESVIGRRDAILSVKAVSNGVAVSYDWRYMSNMNVVQPLVGAGLRVNVLDTQPALRLPALEVDAGAPWQREFSRIKDAQMRRMSKDWGCPVHKDMDKSMRLMMQDDWEAVSNQLDRVYSALYQLPGKPLVRILPVTEIERDQIRRLMEFHKEAGGCWEVSTYWSGPSLINYAYSVLRGMPSNSVYFGGTDTGRFVIQGFQALANRADIVALTQNCLADNNALAYFRYLHGDEITIPSLEESNAAFKEFVDGTKKGIYPSEGVSFKDGRVQVNGVEAVMMINGILARKIFESNPGRDFFVEESYVIPWMNPHLLPHGYIMKLNREPLDTLPADVVEQDFAFWGDQVRALMADPLFLASDEPRTAIAKNRCAIAGLYAWRRMYDAANRAFQQALELCPLAPEAVFRYVECLMQQHRYDEARRLVHDFIAAVPSEPRALDKLKDIREAEAKHLAEQEAPEAAAP